MCEAPYKVRPYEADQPADHSHLTHLPEYHPAYVVTPRTQRHSHADLTSALRHRIREYTVESDRGEQRSEHHKRSRQPADQAIEVHVVLELLPERLEIAHGEVRVDGGHQSRDGPENLISFQSSSRVERDGTKSVVLLVGRKENRGHVLLPSEASFTTATSGAPNPSLAVNSRPAISVTPSVPK